MEARPPTRLYLGIAAAAGAVLALEIGLTRLFSYAIWYHFAYLTISVALLGYGAAGSALAAWPRLGRPGALAWWAVAAEAGVLVALAVIRALPLDPLALGSDAGQLLRLLAYYAAVTVPFLCGGFLVAAPLQRHPRAVGRLYFADLLGAGLACAAIVPLIWWVETPVATAATALLFAVAAVAYAEPGRRLGPALAAGGLAALAVAVAGALDFHPAPTKFVARLLSPTAQIVFHRWTPINRVDVVAFDPPLHTGSYIGWGISPLYRGSAPAYVMIGNDGDSCAVMYQWSGDPAELDFLDHHVLRAPYLLLERPSVLVIGLGGGADVLNALKHGARSVTGVEINPVTVDVGRGLYREWNGDLLRRPGVEPVVAEGRSFLRSRDRRYDLVEINSVDTLSALSTGAYVLSESFLYTADAVRDYLDHLAPGGIFAMAVGDVQGPDRPPRHTLRLAGIVRRALEDRGVREPWRHVMVVGTGGELPFTHTLVRNEPFEPAEVERMAAFLREEGLEFWHRPDATRPATLTSQILRWDDAQLARFYAAHPLDLEPTTDSSPFFFNFYKWGTLARALATEGLGYDRTLATGQIVLVVMLLQSALFSALLIFWPLRRLPREAAAAPRRRLAFLAYFAALGMGFILLEISMIQRFVLFLGYPTYSLTVVMLALLVSTGVGSLATERVRERLAAALPPRLALLLVLGGAWLLGAPAVFSALLGAPLAARVAVSVALLLPLGLVLGSFFPLGIRLLERADARLVPWAWAVNGCATVIGTLVAVMAGMTWSFTAVALAALAIYASGVLALCASERAAAAQSDGSRITSPAEPSAT